MINAHLNSVLQHKSYILVVVIIALLWLHPKSSFAQCQPLAAGTYTVGSASANYPSLEAALTALQCAGVQGPVTLQLAAGQYEGRYVLPALPGVQHQIRISTNDLARFIRPTNSLQPESFVINGGTWALSNLQWERQLTMINPGPLVRITGGASHRIAHCHFTDASADRRDLNQAVWAGQTDSLRIDSSVFEGFGTVVLLSPTTVAKGIVVRGNRWERFKGPAFVANQQLQLDFSHNIISNANGVANSFAGVAIEGVEGLQFYNNRFLGAIPPTALYIRKAIANLALENRVFNNELYGYSDTLNNGTLLQNRIFWVQGDSSVNELLLFVHNTIRFQVRGNSTAPQQALFFMNNITATSDSVGVFNNIFAFDQGDLAVLPAGFRSVLVQQAPLAGVLFNYNVYTPTDTSQAIFGVLQPDTAFNLLANWQQFTGWDGLSRQVNPWFTNFQNTRPANPVLNNIGFYVPWVLTDISGVFRNLVTDPGVFEFDAVQNDVQVLAVNQPATTVCSYNLKEPLRVSVRNLGVDSLSAVHLTVLLNGLPVFNQSFALNLAAGQTVALQFADSLTLSNAASQILEIRSTTALDLRTENDTLRVSLIPLRLQQYPFIENFEGLLPGSMQTQKGWKNVSTQTATWKVHRGPTPTPFTGPSRDATGQTTGQYLYFDASVGQPGDTAYFLLDCLDLNYLASPQLSFRLHGYGADLGSFGVEYRVAGQWFPLSAFTIGQQQGSADAPWITRREFLQTATDAIRFVAVRGSGSRSDWAIDNIQFAEVIGDELVLDSVRYQWDACTFTGNLQAIYYVRNGGITLLTPRIGVQLGQDTPLFRQINRVLAPFDQDTIHFQVPFQNNSEILAKFFAANPGDVDVANDTLVFRLQRNGMVNSFPYFESFENNGNWSRTGQNSSWQRTQPAAVQLNSAFAGQAAWVTAPTGIPNASERSAIESPCFNFSNLMKPQLAFAIQYFMGNRMAAHLQYSTDGGNIWQPLGSLFSGENWYNRPTPAGLNRPGAFWSGSSQGWQQARHDLSFLAGQASVKFRFQFFNDFDTSSVNSALEGLAVDAFEIKESAGAFVYQTTLSPANHCSPQPHTVSTRVANVSGLQSIQLRYGVNGGAEQALPMTLQPNNVYAAIIPAQNQGDLVQWRIVTQSDTLLSSALESYIDGFLQTTLADVSAPQRSQHIFDAGLANTSAFSIALAGVDSARGVWFKVEAKRKLEISGLELQITQFTGIDAYLLGDEPTSGSINRQRLRLLGSARGNMPAGFTTLPFTAPLLLNTGQTAVIFIQGLNANDFRVEHFTQSTPVEDNNIRIFPGRKSTAAFALGSQLALPAARLLVRNPADSIQWRNAAGQLLGNTILHQRQMPALPDLVVLQLYKNGCIYIDTALFASTGTVDLGVVALLQPTLADVVPGVFYPVKVAIRNNGSLNISSYTMAYRVNGVELNITPVEQLIPAGDTIHYTFPQSWTWVETGSIVFCAYPRGLGLDVQTSNDTLCQARFPTSVAERELGALKLYPNPAQNHFWLEANTELAAAQLTVYDVQGRSIHQQNIALGAGERQQIDCSQWANGLYHYRLQQGKHLSSGRVVLQR